MRLRELLCITLFICYWQIPVYSQSGTDIQQLKQELSDYLYTYYQKQHSSGEIYQIISLKEEYDKKYLHIGLNDDFANQIFTKKNVQAIYKKMAKITSRYFRDYSIDITVLGLPLKAFVTDYHYNDEIYRKSWGNVLYKGKPWVQDMSIPYKITRGLYNTHLSIWASHGYYYDDSKKCWKSQRPNLFGINEDLFTSSFVIPYLFPMLENAGANIFTPRERDIQKHEVIIDNDTPTLEGIYQEKNNKKPWISAPNLGFRYIQRINNDSQNPFKNGTARMALTVSKAHQSSSITYQPTFPAEGKYAVYVSYQTIDGSVDDAQYTVFHKGQETTYHVNQQIGGGTWVYLGTHSFDKGCNVFNKVVITNKSEFKGFVTSDAIKFGGGMGNIVRGDSISGLPRHLEGARYYAQWAGAPQQTFDTKDGKNDYADDINVRSLMTNWVSGGSCYVPNREGLGVPLELSLGIHSDAGITKNSIPFVGSLGICTTNHNDNKLAAGTSRMMSTYFCQELLSNIYRDITSSYTPWVLRGIRDQNYSETRLPEVPSAILEMLSHQNFKDMVLGHDPHFKFTMARSIYKSILKYQAYQHGKKYVVTPLAPTHFSLRFQSKNKLILTWKSQDDLAEPTAKADRFIVYTAMGHADFDNGVIVKKQSFSINLEPDMVYNFKVAAVNRGGKSFTTPVLSAVYHPNAKKQILIINGFTDTYGPRVIDRPDLKGFDLTHDVGVPYGKSMYFVGRQTCFDFNKRGLEGENSLGYSDNSLLGQIVTGNTYDGVKSHALAIATNKDFNVISCVSDAIEDTADDWEKTDCLDFMMGLQKRNEHNHYRLFNPIIQQLIKTYTSEHHGKIILSGGYLLNGATAEQNFFNDVFKVTPDTLPDNDLRPYKFITGFNYPDIPIYSELNEKHYAATSPQRLIPHPLANILMSYNDNQGAAVVANATQHPTAIIMAIPFECIKNTQDQSRIMNEFLTTLFKN